MKISAEISEGYVQVRFPYHEGLVQRVKELPTAKFIGRDKGGPYWRLKLDLDVMRELRVWGRSRLVLGPKLRLWGHAAVRAESAQVLMSQATDAELRGVPAQLEREWKGEGLRPYQRADVAFMAQGGGNLNQPGSGKTIDVVCAVMEKGLEQGRHLVVAPVAALIDVWQEEITEGYRVAGLPPPLVLTGETPAERRQAIAGAVEAERRGLAFWLLVNPYFVLMKGGGLVAPELAVINWHTFTVDEFHLMGLNNPGTQGARGVNHIAKMTQPVARWPLSGTPMGGKPLRMFGGLRFLDPVRFSSRDAWAKQWLVTAQETTREGKTIYLVGEVHPHKEVQFAKHIAQYFTRRTKREMLPGLPPKQRIDVWCTMTPKQRKQYRAFEEEAEWRLDEKGGRVTADNVLTEYLRLKQFAAAYCTVEKTDKLNKWGMPGIKVVQTVDSGKLVQLVQKLAEENVFDDEDPRCALVFSQYVPMVEAAARALRGHAGVGVLTGRVPAKERRQLRQAFQAQAPGAPRLLVMSTKLGVTSNLSRADTVHILDETDVPDDQEQAEDRAERGDALTMARDELRIYYYRSRGTIEHRIKARVGNKAVTNRMVLDYYRQRRAA